MKKDNNIKRVLFIFFFVCSIAIMGVACAIESDLMCFVCGMAACVCMSAAIYFVFKMGTGEKRHGELPSEKFRTCTPVGTIVVYRSIDDDNPGIFIDLEKDGYGYALNLACIECNADEARQPLMLHAWTRATYEDTTLDVMFEDIEKYWDRSR